MLHDIFPIFRKSFIHNKQDQNGFNDNKAVDTRSGPSGGHRFAAAYREQSLNMVFRQETCSRTLLQSHGSPRSFFFRAHRAFATSRSIRVRAQSSISNSSQKGSERSGTSTTGVVFSTGTSSMWYVTSSLLHLGNDGTALS